MIGFSKFSAVTLGVFNAQVEDTPLSSSLACTPDVEYLEFSADNKSWASGKKSDATTSSVYAKCGEVHYKCDSDVWKHCSDGKACADASLKPANSSNFVGVASKKASAALLTCGCTNLRLTTTNHKLATDVTFTGDDDAQDVKCKANLVWYFSGKNDNTGVKCNDDIAKHGAVACVPDCQLLNKPEDVKFAYKTNDPSGDLGTTPKIQAKLACKDSNEVFMIDALKSNDVAECNGASSKFSPDYADNKTVGDLKCDTPEAFCKVFTTEATCEKEDHFNGVECEMGDDGCIVKKKFDLLLLIPIIGGGLLGVVLLVSSLI
jgi:hypothetical protein